MVAGKSSSSLLELPGRIPQDSIFSPLLYKIFRKPLGKIMQRLGVRCLQYDTQVFPFLEDQDSIFSLFLPPGFSGGLELMLNPDRIGVMVMGSPRDLGGLRYPSAMECSLPWPLTFAALRVPGSSAALESRGDSGS